MSVSSYMFASGRASSHTNSVPLPVTGQEPGQSKLEDGSKKYVILNWLWYAACRNRHPSGVFSYGNSSITLKMMEKNGTFLQGKIYKDLGYVSALLSCALFLCLLPLRHTVNRPVIRYFCSHFVNEKSVGTEHLWKVYLNWTKSYYHILSKL